jgi:hypothetical protein
MGGNAKRDHPESLNRNAGLGFLINLVMPGLVPGIHVFSRPQKQDVDGRDEPGHDDVSYSAAR